MMSGRLVAATTYTPTRASMPSISVSSWFTTLPRMARGPGPTSWTASTCGTLALLVVWLEAFHAETLIKMAKQVDALHVVSPWQKVVTRLHRQPQGHKTPGCPVPGAAPLGRMADVGAAARRQRIQLVEEEHAGRGRARARKQLPHRALALAHVLVQQLGALSA